MQSASEVATRLTGQAPVAHLRGSSPVSLIRRQDAGLHGRREFGPSLFSGSSEAALEEGHGVVAA